ncbi:MAG: hypothetical protein IIU78_00695 [Alistipes sp.]|nr:hypothetical protein [Alistipes sp.]
MKDLILSLKSANYERAEKRSEMTRISHYAKLFKFLESRFEDGATFSVKNYFDHYKMVVKDDDGNDKTVYGLICDNDKSYLSLNDLAFPKRLYQREVKKVDNEETTSYTEQPNKVMQGDCAVLFDKFKKQYKDSLLAFDLLYLALAKHNNSQFVSESFIYPTETYIRFKGDYVTSNFYLFNLQLGGTSEEKINEIVADICATYDNSLNEEPAEVLAEDMNIKQKQITISLREVLEIDTDMKEIPLIKEFGMETKEAADVKSMKKRNGYKEHTGRYFNNTEYEPKTIFTEADAFKEIEDRYGNVIDDTLSLRDYSMPVLAIGLPFSVFGNRMFLKFVKSSDEDDIEWRFYYHYSGFCLDVLSKDNASIRRIIIKIIYDHFYEYRFKKRIEGSSQMSK